TDADGNKYMECTWPSVDDDDWTNHTASYGDFVDASKLYQSFGKHGFPGSSMMRQDMAAWIAAYVGANKTNLETRKVSDQNGWLDDDSFLLGNECTGGDTGFHALSDGERQLARCLDRR